jgi:hypothetical protein
MNAMDEQVDILVPPLFKQSGVVKSRKQANLDGDWVGTFNLWILNNSSEPSIVYQQRSPDKTWAPNLLDVAVGGHYQAGEKLTDGLREAEEELGKQYQPNDLLPVSRKVYVGLNADGTTNNSVIDIYLVEDDSPLEAYKLQKEEVYALCICPVAELLKAHQDASYSFNVPGILASGEAIEISVNQQSFPENWDDYHFKMALLADRYFKGVKNLIY